MDLRKVEKFSDIMWMIRQKGKMHVPGIIFADELLIHDMDDKIFEQATNIATLPGIVKVDHVMPDGQWVYGFPIGGFAAFDPNKGAIISGGGVGFNISCVITDK